MNITITIQRDRIRRIGAWFDALNLERVTKWTSVLASIGAIAWAYMHDTIVAYGDAESHLNIAKRVVDSLTPGFAQLGGIWLPLPHLFMAPFVYFNWLWRTGFAGSIVSGAAFVVSAVFIYRLTILLTANKWASFAAALVFISNPNALYMQATPMTEMLLIMFQTLSVYFFIKFLQGKEELTSLLMAALFGFASVLTRYDGWFLVLFQAAAIGAHYAFNRRDWSKAQGRVILFATLAFFGIFLWLLWDFLILGDPLYFTNSEFSAKSQQQSWKARGELPSQYNLVSSFLYYFVTAMSNNGVFMFALALIGLWLYIANRSVSNRFLIAFVLGAPFVFNVTTLFLGQSVIFIPHLTPTTFEWTLFNVRYGLMVAPVVALFVGYLFWRVGIAGKLVMGLLFFLQIGLYVIGYSPVISLADGTVGLSAAKRPDAETWLKANYDGGLVLMDDFARTVSLIRSGVPMSNSIYVGNKPYWEESLREPEKYARWIVMQENDTVWKTIFGTPGMEGRLYAHFEKAYTSPQILIFRKQDPKKELVADQYPKLPYQFWPYQCVDTMKTSRDGAATLAKQPNAQELIHKEVSAIKAMGADCVAIATPYDEEFLPYLTMWVEEARAQELHVWFRGNWSAWEGWFGRKKGMTTEEHLARTSLFIKENSELFKDGDIFTPAPEAENGGPFSPDMSAERFAAYRAFLRDEYRMANEAFAGIGTDVTVNWFSMNGWIARNRLDKTTVDAVGKTVTIDHYIKSPEEMGEYIEAIRNAYDAKVVIGEFGAPIPDLNGDMTEDQQAEFVGRLLWEMYKNRASVGGVSYWVAYGGSTKLLNEDYLPRKVVGVIKNYFNPGIVEGRVTNTAGEPLANIEVKTQTGEAHTITDNNGYFALALPAIGHNLLFEGPGYKFKSVRVDILQKTVLSEDIELEPDTVTLSYRRKLWEKRLGDRAREIKDALIFWR